MYGGKERGRKVLCSDGETQGKEPLGRPRSRWYGDMSGSQGNRVGRAWFGLIWL